MEIFLFQTKQHFRRDSFAAAAEASTLSMVSISGFKLRRE
jgi:hypothetical protein